MVNNKLKCTILRTHEFIQVVQHLFQNISKDIEGKLNQNFFKTKFEKHAAHYVGAAMLDDTTWGSVTTCSANGMVQEEQGKCQMWYNRFLIQVLITLIADWLIN